MMYALETASVDAQITLVNPNPSVHLMAATFAREIQCRYERVSASERTVPGRLDVGARSTERSPRSPSTA